VVAPGHGRRAERNFQFRQDIDGDGVSGVAIACGECWLVIGLDDFLAKLPGRWIEVGAWVGSRAGEGIRLEREGDRANFHIGELARRLMHAYRRSVREIACAGINVVVDEVSLHEDEWDDWCAALDGLGACGSRCVAMSTSRRNERRPRGDRALGLVRGQADVVHRFPVYDLELDTTVASVEEVARRLEEFVSNLRTAEP
jgi:chloramphenicol 3-O-phosphotransferase